MLRLLPWSSALVADKGDIPEIKMLAARQHRSPSMDSQKSHKLKRKRADSSDSDLMRHESKRRVEHLTQAAAPQEHISSGSSRLSPPATQVGCMSQPVDHPRASSPIFQDNTAPTTEDSIPMNTVLTEAKVRSLRQTIQSQLGLEILLKHNELRLIDQEIAKCQVALEQLRRCSEVPYPASTFSAAVSQGVGPSLRPPSSAILPQSPTPWGVTDGPYARHYAKWLLPDARFDGCESALNVVPTTPGGKTPRTTRGSFAESSANAGQSRSQRSGKLKALSTGYPQPKDKTGPMIQKRKSDGQIVKLVCLDCRRDNFSSAQGFINHCRIAHSRNFASHDAAADACGEPVEVDEAGVIIGNDATSLSMAGIVHPLIRSAHLFKQTMKPAPTVADAAGGVPERSSDSSTSVLQKTEDHLPSIEHSTSAPNYAPSPLTPNLSALVRRMGMDLNLENLVSDAKTQTDLGESSADESEHEDDTPVIETPAPGRHPQLARTMQLVRSTMSPTPLERPNTIKGFRGGDLTPPTARALKRPSSPSSPPAAPKHHPPPDIAPDAEGLEPSPINEAHQAPSLVDDDDDELEARTSSSSSSVSADHEIPDVDFEVEDDDESGPSSTHTASATVSDFAGSPKPHVQPPHRRRSSAFRRSIGSREEKHVTFVSPAPGRERDDRKKGNVRKRRKS